MSTGALVRPHRRRRGPRARRDHRVGGEEERRRRSATKVCGGCKRVMLPVWTKCLFCGWAPVARLEFILGPMANQTLPLTEEVTTIGSVAGNTRRARRSGGVAQARRHPQDRRATTSSPTSGRRTACTSTARRCRRKRSSPATSSASATPRRCSSASRKLLVWARRLSHHIPSHARAVDSRLRRSRSPAAASTRTRARTIRRVRLGKPHITAMTGDDDRCDPTVPRVCMGQDVVECGSDGHLGRRLRACHKGCSDGKCEQTCEDDNTKLIYVVSTNNDFLSFDPRKLPGDPFHLIGKLKCRGGGSPFSMSVDRNGIAWVLYGDGELFKVNINDAKCEPTAFSSRLDRLDDVRHGVLDGQGRRRQREAVRRGQRLHEPAVEHRHRARSAAASDRDADRDHRIRTPSSPAPARAGCSGSTVGQGEASFVQEINKSDGWVRSARSGPRHRSRSAGRCLRVRAVGRGVLHEVVELRADAGREADAGARGFAADQAAGVGEQPAVERGARVPSSTPWIPAATLASVVLPAAVAPDAAELTRLGLEARRPRARRQRDAHASSAR